MTDLILRGADIRSAPFNASLGDVLRVRAGAVIAVETGYRQEGGNRPVVIELGGGCLLPGFVDAHLHFSALVRRKRSLDCSSVRGATGLLAVVGEAARAGSGWLFAHGLEHRVPGFGALPTLAELNRATGGRPLWLRHRSGHLSLLNGAALEELNLRDADPPQGRLVREAGRPTGLAHDLEPWLGAWMRERQAPAAETDIARTAEELLRLGVTAFADLTPANRAEDLPRWAGLHSAGTIPQRMSLWVDPLTLRERSRMAGRDRVRIGGAKIMIQSAQADGARADGLVPAFRQAARGGWPVAVHAVEGDALAMALDAWRRSRQAPPYLSPRLRIEHGHRVEPALVEELRHQLAELCVQPGMIWEQGEVYAADIPREQWPELIPVRSLDLAAAALAIGSDAPAAPLNPLRHVAAAVTRRDRQGIVWNAGEALTVERALAAITCDAARLAGFGAELGELAPGRSADAVYFHLGWDELRSELLAGEVPEPAATLIRGRWRPWPAEFRPVRLYHWELPQRR